MLYHLLYPLKDYFFGFNVFRYISFRAVGAGITSLLIVLIFGPAVIRGLRRIKIGERVRKGKDYSSLYNLHKEKEGTPTMGGVLVILAVLFSTFFWADIFNMQILLVTFALLWLGGLGFVDDYIKLKGNSRGLPAWLKILGQVILAMAIVGFVCLSPETRHIANELCLPFYKTPIDIMWFVYLGFTAVVICGSSNAVNLTDGLDGLAIGSVLIVAASYIVLSYIAGNIKFSNYLNVLYVPGSGELAVFCTSIVGAGLGFLWFNAYPAEVFMGDTGSLALGGVIGVVSVLIKKELWLFIIGGIFVMEAVSVILQISSFKLRGKRVFAMAPIHHHFQMKGWPESKITIRFWIISIIFALIGLGSLKLQ